MTIPKLISVICLKSRFFYAFLLLGNQRNRFLMAENNIYEGTECKNSVQSSLKPHPLWFTLYLTHTNTCHLLSCRLSSDLSLLLTKNNNLSYCGNTQLGLIKI